MRMEISKQHQKQEGNASEPTSAEIKDAIEVAPNERPSSSKESSTSSRRMYGSSDMVKIFIPVSLCMLIVVLCVRNIEDYSDDHVIPAPYVIYREPESEPTTKFWKSLVNAGVLMGIIVVFTCILVLLFYLRCFARFEKLSWTTSNGNAMCCI
ncbi:hypothetical protein GCK32_005103 [Trichostrongylus colubriformis]|uniref:Uncharacterized protein n=1 Tax=Trichostrongylus colubriformis TaxID=6319 RepID=A0AAN8F634_TRICO